MPRFHQSQCPPPATSWLLASTLPFFLIFTSAAIAQSESNPIVFKTDIRPLLETHCYKCHGADKHEGGLRLDHRTSALDGGDFGVILQAGKSSESALMNRLRSTDDNLKMPPPGDDNKPLSDAQIALIATWIDQGAAWPLDPADAKLSSDHWAFQSLRDTDVPVVQNAPAVRNEIDSFVLARLEQAEIAPSPRADRFTLIKRLYYDLLGLTPSIEEVDAFVHDNSPQAYDRLIDRLLKSPHFGERWGRHWLDKARYADSDGYEGDRPRPNAWRYRDWVIKAINTDLPFDAFTRQQLAGDLLPEATHDQRLATAFHRQTLTNREGGTDQEQFRNEALFDRVATTGAVWLGLTIGCAQCHSHKYDPISQREYYQFFAFYNNGDETNTAVPTSDKALAHYQTQKSAWNTRTEQLNTELANALNIIEPHAAAWEADLRKRFEASPPEFHTLDFSAMTAESGATFQQLDDGSYLVVGKRPDKDKYSLTVKLDIAQVTGIRIETIPDSSLPGGGAGHADNGNFVLSDLRVYYGGLENPDIEHDRVTIARGRADFSQENYAVVQAFDSDTSSTGWAVAPQMSEPHEAIFTFDTPLERTDDAWCRIVLAQDYGALHTLGRLRISAVTGIDPRDELSPAAWEAFEIARNQRSEAQHNALLTAFAHTQPETRETLKAIAVHQKKEPQVPMMDVRVISQRTTNPRTTHILSRGDFLQPLEAVEPASFQVLHSLKPRSTGRPDRLDLANWLVDSSNPLTPRVAVNHVWSYLFGQGLVTTMNDFGLRGDAPTHPELLDWLANQYRGPLGWSRKALIKRIVSSGTYQQASWHRPELADTDPDNSLLYRQNRFRVEAEIIRDLCLSASGLLARKIGGPSVFPPMPPDVAALSYANNFKWNTSEGSDQYRRGLYTFFKRTAPHPNLTAFDCPDSNTSCVERRYSNTPLQALTTLNNQVFVEAGQALAQRALTDFAESDEGRISSVFRRCVARPPDSDELAAFTDLLQESRKWYGEHPEEATLLAGKVPKGQPTPETAAWVTVCRIILNMDEFIVRE